MIGFVYLVAAIILISFWGTIGILFVIVKGFLLLEFRLVMGYFGNFAKSISIVIDILGNVLCGPLFNVLLRKTGGYEFGSYKDTISKVLGINKRTVTLTKPGRILANALNWYSPGHVERASDDYFKNLS